MDGAQCCPPLVLIKLQSHLDIWLSETLLGLRCARCAVQRSNPLVHRTSAFFRLSNKLKESVLPASSCCYHHLNFCKRLRLHCGAFVASTTDSSRYSKSLSRSLIAVKVSLGLMCIFHTLPRISSHSEIRAVPPMIVYQTVNGGHIHKKESNWA